VRDIREILPAGEIVRRFAAAVGGSRSAVGGSPANR